MENKPFPFNSIFMFLFSIVFNSFKFFLSYFFLRLLLFIEFIWNHLLVSKVSNLDWSRINLALKRWEKSLTANTLVKLGLFDLEKGPIIKFNTFRTWSKDSIREKTSWWVQTLFFQENRISYNQQEYRYNLILQFF